VVKQSRSIQRAHSIRFEFPFQCTMLACTPERWDIWNISEVLAYGTVARILYVFIFVSSTNPQWNRFVPARHYPRPQTWTSPRTTTRSWKCPKTPITRSSHFLRTAFGVLLSPRLHPTLLSQTQPALPEEPSQASSPCHQHPPHQRPGRLGMVSPEMSRYPGLFPKHSVRIILVKQLLRIPDHDVMHIYFLNPAFSFQSVSRALPNLSQRAFFRKLL